MKPLLSEGAASPRSRLRNAPVIERVMYRTAVAASGCWLWVGAKNVKGYGHVRDGAGRLVAVYRVVWEHVNGPIPQQLEIDHLCFNRACVNPEHLEAVSHAENVRRGKHNQNHGKTACVRGHVFDAENTRMAGGKRVCRLCCRDRQRTYRAKGLA